MLLPREVFELHRSASTDPTRFQLNGVHIHRDAEGNPRACSTDGKVLTTMTWREDNAEEYPSIDGLDPSHNGGKFASTIRTEDCKRILRTAVKSSPKPILENVVIDEHSAEETCGKQVTVGGTDLDTTSRQTVYPIDGEFPNYTVITDEVDKRKKTELRFNPLHLKRALEVLLKATGRTKAGLEKEKAIVTMQVVSADKPISLWYRGNGREVRVMVMPLVTD